VLIEQDGTALGERMLNCVDSLAAKHNAVVIVGSDTPRINSEFIQLAVQNYNGWQVLLGPCKDGGFYLFGAKQAHRNIFDNVLWSKEQVMLTTLLNCEKLSLAVRLLPESEDIDDLNSLQSVRPKLNSKNSNLVKIIEQLELVQ
jgi:glycosyltransferase A (GT-A) superfamily protein (DUF2064 family)